MITLIGLPVSLSPDDYHVAPMLEAFEDAYVGTFLWVLPRGLPPPITYYGLNGCFLGSVSARCMISKICSDESILTAELPAMVERRDCEPPPTVDCFMASLLNSSTAWPTTLFILYELTGRFW